MDELAGGLQVHAFGFGFLCAQPQSFKAHMEHLRQWINHMAATGSMTN
jgi:hypothetical protein